MSYLNWNLDTEDGIDAYDPLGDIIILGDRGKLEEKSTYLDAFFEALIQGSQRFKKGKIVEIDTLVEPDDLVFDYTDKNLVIYYGKQKALILDTNQFVQDVYDAVKTLIETLDKAATEAKEEFPKLKILRNFVEEKKEITFRRMSKQQH